MANIDAVEMLRELTNEPGSAYSRGRYQQLVYAILSDPEYKAKKLLLRKGELIEADYSIHEKFVRFLDKFLKHAGVTDREERKQIIETFEMTPKDTEWFTDCIDEAIYQYIESGKNMRLFQDRMLRLTIKKIKRTGKHEGEVTYKKSVVDRSKRLQKEKQKGEGA